jgi:predicted O-methyltransferase YrrM
MVETGVASGWSTLAVLLAMRENGRGRLYSSDMPYAKLNNEDFVGTVVPPALRDRWTLTRKPDRDALPELFAKIGSVDVIHHDSDKSYEGRMFVYEAGWAKLREGGLLLSDDIEDNLAFRDFAVRAGREPLVLAKAADNFAGLLKK